MKTRFLETDQEVLNFIIQYKVEHNGNSPTLRQVVDGTRVKTTSHAHTIVKKLVSFDKIQIEGGTRNFIIKGYAFVKFPVAS